MSDESTVMSGGEAPESGASVTEDAAQDWRSGLSDEYRGKYEEFKSPEDFVKGYDNLVKKIGSDPLVRPKDDASDDEKQAYKDKLYAELGLNVEADAYKYELPSDIPQTYKDSFDNEALKPFQEWAHENKVPPQAFEQLLNMYVGREIEQSNKMANTIEHGYQEAETKLREQYGDKYDETVKRVSQLAMGIDPEFATNPMYGNDPNVIAFIEKLSQNITVEQEGKLRDSGHVDYSDASSLREKALELNAKANDDKLRIEDRREAAAQATEIYRKIVSMQSSSKG